MSMNILKYEDYLGHGLLGLLHIKIRKRNELGGLGCFPFSWDALDLTRHEGRLGDSWTRSLLLHNVGGGEAINILEVESGAWLTGTYHSEIQGVILILIYLY